MTANPPNGGTLEKALPWIILAVYTLATTAFVIEIDSFDHASERAPGSNAAAETASAIHHVVVIVQENHSFDSYFGRYCKAPAGSHPTCETGRDCCEAGPEREPGRQAAATVLDDKANGSYSPDHSQYCENLEINGGKMDGFVTTKKCGNPLNFAYATSKSTSLYWSLADGGALADRYFQPVVGASSANDMYLARAQFVFNDNQIEPDSIGSRCGGANPNRKTYDDATIGDLLSEAGVSWAFYAEGYAATIEAQKKGRCPAPDPRCHGGGDAYPCIYDPSDNPFQYYRSSLDNPTTQRDYAQLAKDITAGRLPAVSFIKPLGFRTEHPGDGTTIRDGMKFLSEVLKAVNDSPYARDTLILITFDESGGYFDHIPPPKALVDGKAYGPRIPLLAVGKFARRGAVSHQSMEHSSIVRFIEWNWLGATGQLHGRDAAVHNIGSLLDSSATGAIVPSD